MNEIWKDIKGFEGLYRISSEGRVFSIKKNSLKKNNLGANGYFRVSLWRLKKPHYIYIHRLIAGHFIENPKNLKCVNHKNGNKQDNRIKNLEWCSHSFNNKHAYEIGLKTPLTKLSKEQALKVLDLKKNGLSNKEIGDMMGVSRQTIYSLVTGRSWKKLHTS